MNAFEQIADLQQNAFSKARDRAKERRLAKLVVKSEADAPMVASPSDKATWEASQLMRRYRALRRKRATELRAVPAFAELFSLLDDLDGSSPQALIAWIDKALWLQDADYNTRHDALSFISEAIASHRVRSGLAPFDDSLWGEPPTAFQVIRKTLTGVGHD